MSPSLIQAFCLGQLDAPPSAAVVRSGPPQPNVATVTERDRLRLHKNLEMLGKPKLH